MRIRAWINKVANIGVKAHYLPWEIYLTRKLNYLCLLGFLNVSFSLVFFVYLGFTDFILECFITLCAAPFVIIFNYWKNYIWAAYQFYIMGIVLFYFMTLQMGVNSFVILFYFPILISLVNVFGRKETLKHLFIISGLFFVSIVAVSFGYNFNYLNMHLAEDFIIKLRMFNILSSFFLTVSLISVLTNENVKQETVIKNMLKEKEILLAEVFHRVKNNMNIVTSLLNLKKHSSKSEEVKLALEECRERVFSMALVHQKIYNNKSVHSLNFTEYINDLVHELLNSIGGKENVDVDFKIDDVDLPINYAIPAGLILNELITNSFKHAQTHGEKLKINIELKQANASINLKVKDNGSGFDFDFDKDKESQSLGMELIKSLVEQIEGHYKISNQNGCLFELNFKLS